MKNFNIIKKIFLLIAFIAIFSFISLLNTNEVRADIQQSVMVSATVYACEIELITDTISNDKYLLEFSNQSDHFKFQSKLRDGIDLIDLCKLGIFKIGGRYDISFRLSNTYVNTINVDIFKFYRNKLSITTKNLIGNTITCNNEEVVIKPLGDIKYPNMSTSLFILMFSSMFSKLAQKIYYDIRKILKVYTDSIKFCYILLKKKTYIQ